MGFFKRPHATNVDGNLHGSNLPTGQQQWQQQQATLNDHRRAELQDLSRRMHKLNVQMDDLTASLRGPGMPHSAPDPFTQATFAKNPSAHSAQPMESHHPGPCPFPAEPENSRFVEIDEPADQEGHNASFPHVHRQGQDSPHSSADQFSQAHLEQLLQEGSQARPAFGSTNVGSGPVPGPPSGLYNQLFGMGPLPNLNHQTPLFNVEAGQGRMLSQADIPRRGVSMDFTSMPGNAAGASSPFGLPGASPGFASHGYGQGIPMASGNLPTMGSMPQLNRSQQLPPSHLSSPFLYGNQSEQMNTGFQFPNPFNLEQGPHRPGFGNGFTMQQMPPVMGQMGAHFNMPGMSHMGRPATPRSAFGF